MYPVYSKTKIKVWREKIKGDSYPYRKVRSRSLPAQKYMTNRLHKNTIPICICRLTKKYENVANAITKGNGLDSNHSHFNIVLNISDILFLFNSGLDSQTSGEIR